MKYFKVIKNYHECNEVLGEFETKDLAIQFVRDFYPKLNIKDIDKEHISYYNNDKYGVETKDVKHIFNYDLSIFESTISKTIPKMYLIFTTNFNTISNLWETDVILVNSETEYGKIEIEHVKNELENKNYSKIIFSSILEVTKEDDIEELKEIYENEILEIENRKFYKSCILLSDGNIIDENECYNNKKVISYSNIDIKYKEVNEIYDGKIDLEIINEKDEIIYIEKTSIVCVVKDNKIIEIIEEGY